MNRIWGYGWYLVSTFQTELVLITRWLSIGRKQSPHKDTDALVESNLLADAPCFMAGHISLRVRMTQFGSEPTGLTHEKQAVIVSFALNRGSSVSVSPAV